MKILAVDDEWNQLELLKKAIKEVVSDCELEGFQNPFEALAWGVEHMPEIAFLDIRMPGMNGILLGKKLKEHNPKINLIFVTAFYEKYVQDAVPLRFSGYLEKPVTKEAIAVEMENLRFPISEIQSEELLTIRCFGEFEVFYEGKPLPFSRSKTKELFAYLIDRKGARVNGSTICAVIYENEQNEKNNKSDLRKCTVDLRESLRAVNAESVFIKEFDSYAIDTSLVKCDYYDWEKEEPYAVRSFHGEYMSQYSWSESTLSSLIHSE